VVCGCAKVQQVLLSHLLYKESEVEKRITASTTAAAHQMQDFLLRQQDLCPCTTKSMTSNCGMKEHLGSRQANMLPCAPSRLMRES